MLFIHDGHMYTLSAMPSIVWDISRQTFCTRLICTTYEPSSKLLCLNLFQYSPECNNTTTNVSLCIYSNLLAVCHVCQAMPLVLLTTQIFLLDPELSCIVKHIWYSFREYVGIEAPEWCPAGIFEHFENPWWRPRWPPFHEFSIICSIMVHVFNRYYSFF